MKVTINIPYSLEDILSDALLSNEGKGRFSISQLVFTCDEPDITADDQSEKEMHIDATEVDYILEPK